jgi:uracil phosphoribosyltransferase
MVTNLSAHNSVFTQWIREIRDINIQPDRMRFRRNMERIGEVAAYEISKKLQYHTASVQTPMGESEMEILLEYPVLATVLRAGIPLHQGLLNYFDQADSAFVAAYLKQKDGSFDIELEYITCPDVNDRPLIIADPMIATGATMALALQTLLDRNTPSQVHIVTAIGCTVGIDFLLRKFPSVHIWAGAIDDELTARGNIVPGLGDAGDLCYGDKLQS